METEGSLPYSQKPATATYSEPYEYILQSDTLFLWNPFSYYFPTYDVSPKWSLLPSGFPTKIMYVFLFLPCMLYAPSISSTLIWST